MIQPRACVNAFGDGGGEDDVGADAEVVARCADGALCAVQTLVRVCALQSSTTSVRGRPGLRLQKKFSCNHCLRQQKEPSSPSSSQTFASPKHSYTLQPTTGMQDLTLNLSKSSSERYQPSSLLNPLKKELTDTGQWGFPCERQSSEVLKAGKWCATPVSKAAKSKVLKLRRCCATYRQSGQVTLRDVGVNEAFQFLLKVDVWCPCAAGPSPLAGHAWTKSWIQRLLWWHARQVSGDRITREMNHPCYALHCDILHLLLSNQCFSQVFQTVW